MQTKFLLLSLLALLAAGAGADDTLRAGTPRPFNVLVPVDWSNEPPEEHVRALQRLYDDYDLRKFVLITPWTARYFGRGTLASYRKSGRDLAWATEAMRGRSGTEIGWWVAPSIGSARDFPGQLVMDCEGHANDGRCPLSEEFAAAFCQAVVAGISQAKPRYVFIEDDYTLANQGALNSMRGCFCPLHCADFARRVGKTYAPAEIAGFFRRPTADNLALRQAFADTIRESLVSFARKVRQAIDGVDPTIRVCVCQSISADWDGDSTEAVARAFAGRTRPMSRIYGSAYGNESLPADLPFRLAHTIWTLGHVSRDVEMIHETDAFPHSRFYNSSFFLLSELAAAVAAGAEGSYFYGTQYNDAPLSDTGYFDRLKEYRTRLAVVRDLRAGLKSCGVRGIYDPKELYLSRASAPGYFNGMLPMIGRFLGKMGLPLTTASDAPVAVLAENSVDFMTDDEVRSLLSGGVLIDGRAATKLSERGFADLIGCEAVDAPYDLFYAYEKILPASGCTGPGKKAYNRHCDWKELPGKKPTKAAYMLLKPKAGTEEWAGLFDLDGRHVMPTVLFCRNALGGRVGVLHQRLLPGLSVSTYVDRKQEMVHRLFNRLAEGKIDVTAPRTPATWLVASRNDTTLLFLAENLSNDPRADIVFAFSEKWRGGTVERLLPNGTWAPLGVAGETFAVPEACLMPLRPEFFRVVTGGK